MKQPEPQLLLLSFDRQNPEDFQVTPYSIDPYGTLGWVDDCYRIGDQIYISSVHSGTGVCVYAIDLNTAALRSCQEEYASARAFAEDKFPANGYLSTFGAVLEQDGVIVYSGKVSEGFDAEATGVVSVAYQEGKLIGRMSMDLTADPLSEGIETEVVHQAENGEE